MTKEEYFKIKRTHTVKKGCILLTLITLLAISFHTVSKPVQDVMAAAVTHGVAINNEIPSETGTKGTESNPFVILEIVPYEGYAEIGYLIDGCEPVNMDKLRYSGMMTTVTATNASTANWGVRYQFADETGIPTDWTSVNEEKTLYGYYERVAENTGYFIQEKNQETGLITYKKVGANKGNLKWKTVFEMTQDDVQSNRLLNTIGDRVYTTRKDTACKKGYAYTYKNYNYFLDKVLNISATDRANYHIVVKTITPNELNSQLGWINRADLISISPKPHIGGLPAVWEQYNKAGKSAVSSPPTSFYGNDLSWEAVMKIFKKVNVEKDYAAIIIDCVVYTEPPNETKREVIPCQLDYNGKMTNNNLGGKENGNSNNVYKLAFMMKTMDPHAFYNLFLNDYNGTITPLVQNGLFTAQKTDNEKRYWSQSTFMPTQKDGTGAWNKHWDSEASWETYKLNSNLSGNVSVIGRVFTYNSDCTMTQHFVNNTISVSANKFTEELSSYILSNGGENDPATAVQYILGVQNNENIINKENLTILDLEPCKDFTITAHTIRMMIPYYSGTIKIVPMTSSEFIGTIEDLNSKYDMIYLGMNCGGFNTATKYIAGANMIVPDYNDNLLDGKIYLHVGDSISATLGNSGSNLNSNLNVNWINGANSIIRLPGNDITALKAEALNNYLAAGYPILTDTKLYQTGSTLTNALVDSNSIIYQFIAKGKTSAAKDSLIDSADTYVNKKVLDKIKNEKPQLILSEEPKEYIGTETGGIISDTNYINSTNLKNRKLNFIYTIKGIDTTRYNVYLYIDGNADGRFADSEINMSQSNVMANVSNTLIKPLASDYFGVIPWKLKIVDVNNEFVCDEVKGYSAVMRSDAQKEEIKVLQINPDSTTLNLQKNVADRKLFYTYTRDLNDYKVTFKTITISEFEKMYEGKPFLSSTDARKESTDQLLKDYNMLILGFGDSYANISNSNGALDNIKYFIENYRSVLFTHDTTSPYNMSYNPSPAGYNFNLNFRGILGMDRFGVRKIDKDSYPDKDWYTDSKGKSIIDNTIYPGQIHGYTYFTAAKKANVDQKLAYKNILSGPNGSRGGTFTTNTVTRLNDGQLTEYPYKIDETFTVAATHSQWNQLNLNDPEIVVWYCLGEQQESAYADRYKVYNASPKDASNNYYIYNKGNITYSGVGHSSTNNNLEPMETKLFVNTMIAAYKNSLRNPTIEVTNQDAFTTGKGQYAFYLNSDVNEDTTYVAGDKITIEFIPWDYNFLSQNLGVTATLPDGTPLDIYNEAGVKVTTSFVNKDGKNMINLLNGNTYTVQYDKSLFNSEQKRQIIFTIENEKGLEGASNVQFYKKVLFDLD